MKKRQIKIKTQKEFDALLAQGYKIVDTYGRMSWSRAEKDQVSTDYNYSYIFLENENERLTVDCSNSEVSSMYYEQVADIDGTSFDRIENQHAKADIEMYTYDYFPNGRHIPIVDGQKIEKIGNKKILQYVRAFVKNKLGQYTQNHHDRNLFNLFTDTIVIFEDHKGIHSEIFDKENFRIKHLQKLRTNSKNYKSCHAFSFFQLFSRGNVSEFDSDIFVGCILYDLKNQKTISFNLISTLEDNHTGPNSDSAKEYANSCKKIFEKSFTPIEIQSKIHVTILNPMYTPVPWIYFAVLYPFKYVKNIQNPISIGEFFVFGISKDIRKEDSFYYDKVTKDRRGSAVVQFDINNKKPFSYQLRFDVSKGEQFLHLDFGYYDEKNKMNKLLSHYPLDMELIKKFKHRLFVAIISAGFYDPEFAEILKYRLKNTAEILRKHKELSTPFKLIHNTDQKLKWLIENNLLEEFIYICNNFDSTNIKKYYKITNKFHDVFVRDEQKRIQPTYSGLMILVRTFTKPDQKLKFVEEYLFKHNLS